MLKRMTLTLGILELLSGTVSGQLPPSGVRMEPGMPDALLEVGIEQQLDGQLPLDAVFRDESGNEVQLGDYFNEKPVVLALVYYQCPMLCNQVLNGLTSSLSVLEFDVGDEFEVVAVSFDPREDHEVATAKKRAYVDRYGREGSERGWHFLTGEDEMIRRLTSAAGFRYSFDEKIGQYAHASAIMVITPEGRLARYFYGIEYAPRDLRLALVEASENRIGSPVDQLLLYCYQYDPATGRYGAVVMNMMRIGGLVTVLGIVAMMVLLKRRAPDPKVSQGDAHRADS